MSGQNTLLVIAEDSQVKRPNGKFNWQVYRDTSNPGSGIYKAMDENGNIEIIGGPGASSGGDTFESGSFTLSSDGLTGTGNVNGNPVTYNPVTKVMTFPTSKRLKSWEGLTFDNLSQYSNGSSDGIIQYSSGTGVNPPVQSDPINCIWIENKVLFPNPEDKGWKGLITSINNNSFDITFTSFADGGLDIIGQFHLEEQ